MKKIATEIQRVLDEVFIGHSFFLVTGVKESHEKKPYLMQSGWLTSHFWWWVYILTTFG